MPPIYKIVNQFFNLTFDVLDNEEGIELNMSKIWKDMIEEVDSDGDGKIQVDDFMKLFESKLAI